MDQRDVALVLAQGVVREDRQCLDAMMEYAKLYDYNLSLIPLLSYLLQTSMCKSYQAMGQRDMALVLAQGVVREDRQCLKAMMEYAKLTNYNL